MSQYCVKMDEWGQLDLAEPFLGFGTLYYKETWVSSLLIISVANG